MSALFSLFHGGGEGLAVSEPLQLLGQIIDLAEASVVLRGDQFLELDAGITTRGIGIADRVAIQRQQHRPYPSEHVLDGREVHAHCIAE